MNSVINISDNIMLLYKGEKEWKGDKRTVMRSGNPNLDKFVFVSDLINRDLYTSAESSTTKPQLDLSKPTVEVPPTPEVTPAPAPEEPPAPPTEGN